MPRVRLLLCLSLLLPRLAQAASDSTPVLSGYVTALDPSGAFDVEAEHIRVTPTTLFLSRVDDHTSRTVSPPPTLHVGQAVDVFGRLDKKSHTVSADRVILAPNAPAAVHGTAIIDLIPAPSADVGPLDPWVHLIRADGYTLRITAKTALTFTPPLASSADLTTNLWIEYSGVQQLDGTVALDRATLRKNEIKWRESKMRSENEYDPAAVPADAHQGFFSKAVRGVDPRKIPPVSDQAMQDRVVRIGNSLIPAFQHNLPDSDPTKIAFRFQVVDSDLWRDASNLPNGIIIVPRQVVDRLRNDSQLAAVLADNIAEAFEKLALRSLPAKNGLAVANFAGAAAEFVVPGAGIVTSFATGSTAAHLLELQLRQSGRVSLCLLHDAGYDITQAPIAWRLLAPKNPTPLDATPVPSRADNLYMLLGTTWRAAL